MRIPIKDFADDSSSHHAQRSPLSFALTILLLGLAPTVTAYIFSAAYDFILGFNQFVPGPYPTLRILSALLPWQVPIPIDLNGGIQNIIIFSLLWRIPLFLGNPTLFDLQALEAYIFNGAALALLLLTLNINQPSVRRENHVLYPGWATFLGMETALGLILVLPAESMGIERARGINPISWYCYSDTHNHYFDPSYICFKSNHRATYLYKFRDSTQNIFEQKKFIGKKHFPDITSRIHSFYRRR